MNYWVYFLLWKMCFCDCTIVESSQDMIELVSNTKKVVRTGGTRTRFSTVAGVEITRRIAKHSRLSRIYRR